MDNIYIWGTYQDNMIFLRNEVTGDYASTSVCGGPNSYAVTDEFNSSLLLAFSEV